MNTSFDLFRLRVLVAPIQARGRRQSFGGPSAAPLARQDKGLAHRSGQTRCVCREFDEHSQ
ncbi:hypothetical protein CUJ84_Chr004828 [Rhizobium leguminosarum]|uniref:Uncharacterized protein n=1 Tax=Rhizobium leguminosarum TaxID=384 RepID=A0A2K9ZA43_RHILE|nr:hypothetical protein CUJ84_Chr004828 [Rhizobium leguminosarum]